MNYQAVLLRCQGDTNLARNLCQILEISVPVHPLFSPEFAAIVDKYHRSIGHARQHQRYLNDLYQTAESFAELAFVINLVKVGLPSQTLYHLTKRLASKAATFAQIVTVYEVAPHDSPEEQWALKTLVDTGTFADWFWFYHIHQPFRNYYNHLYEVAPIQMAECLKKEMK